MKILKKSIFPSNHQWFFFFLTIYLCSNLLNCNKSNSHHKSNNKSHNKNKFTSKLLSNVKNNLRGYFWVQKLYPGTDPLDIIEQSEFKSYKKVIEVNDQLIFIAESLETIEEPEDIIKIDEIFDDKNDILLKANCCSRVTYEEYPAGDGLKTIIPAIKNTIKGKKLLHIAKTRKNAATCLKQIKKTKKKEASEESRSNFCINIFVPDEIRWRICSDKKMLIKKLQFKIIFNVLRHKSKNSKIILQKLVDNSQSLFSPSLGNWNWDQQEKWKNMCSKGIMQSPIDYISGQEKRVKKSFQFSMQLKKTHTLVKKNFGELIVVFLNFAGVLKLSIEGGFIMYTPQYMSFRFPGETIINGKRSQGDIQIHFQEMASMRVNNLFFLLNFLFLEKCGY